jgi:hypothetical protein
MVLNQAEMKSTNAARLSWDTIDYSAALPDGCIVPEAHWPGLQGNLLKSEQRVRLNHFAAYFMCEMFIHFERSIIDYMQLHKVRILRHLSEKQFRRFIDEELDHVQAFEKLARKIRPDLYLDKPRFMVPTAMDRLVVRRTALSTFFVMAALFEEMTLFVAPVMEDDLSQSWQPALDVMRLHALEERGHVGMDCILIEGSTARNGAFRTRLEMIPLLPLVAYSDARVAGAWKKAAAHFAREEHLQKHEARQIADKGMSASDILGMRSFVQKSRRWAVPGTTLLCLALTLKAK